MKINAKAVKGLGVLATVVGLGANLLSGWVGQKQMDDTIAQKVSEAMNNMSKES